MWKSCRWLKKGHENIFENRRFFQIFLRMLSENIFSLAFCPQYLWTKFFSPIFMTSLRRCSSTCIAGRLNASWSKYGESKNTWIILSKRHENRGNCKKGWIQFSSEIEGLTCQFCRETFFKKKVNNCKTILFCRLNPTMLWWKAILIFLHNYVWDYFTASQQIPHNRVITMLTCLWFFPEKVFEENLLVPISG